MRKRNAPLPTMGMTADDQIAVHCTIEINIVRTMRDQNAKSIRMVFLGDLAGWELHAAPLVFHAIDLDLTAILCKQGAAVVQHMNSFCL